MLTPSLDPPLTVAKFFKNRRHDVIVLRLGRFQRHAMADLREWRDDAHGITRPTAHGISLKLGKLRELQRAIEKAVLLAEQLGLLPPEVR